MHFLFADLDSGGSLPPAIAVMRQVLAAGHRVSVIGDPTMVEDLAAAGITDFRPWVRAPHRTTREAEGDYVRDWEPRTAFGRAERFMGRLMVGPAPEFAADTLAAIDEVRPDAVVCGLPLLGAQMACEARGVPFVVLAPNAALLPVPGMPPPGMLPGTGLVGAVRDRLFLEFAVRITGYWLPGLNRARAELGLPPLRRMFDQYDRADRFLKLTARSFDFPAELPTNVRYVGPQLDDPGWVEEWSPPQRDDRQFVLVGLSSGFMSQVEPLRRIVEALGSLPVRALVTTGPAVDPGDFVPAGNVTVVRSAPHAQVLPHTDLVITHGGHGTVMKALSADAPIVCVPLGRDQPDVAARIRFHGAGVTVSRAASARTIAEVVERVLEDPTFAANAAAVGALIRAETGTGAVVAELEAVAAARRSGEPAA